MPRDEKVTRASSPDENQEASMSRANAFEAPQQHSLDSSGGYSNPDDDDDLPPLEYARRYGLVTSHLQEQPLQAEGLVLWSGIASSDSEDAAPHPNIDGTERLVTSEGSIVNEKWTVDRDTAEYLANTLALGKYVDFEDMLCDDDHPQFRSLRIREPILSSDPEIDLWRLKQRNKIAIALDGMEAVESDDQIDDDPSWLERTLTEAAKTVEQIASEKFDVDRDIVKYMSEVLNLSSPLPEAMTDEAVDSAALRYPSPETPTLLPLSPPLSPAGLSTSAAEVEMTSTPENLIAKEAACVEQQIFDLDESISPISSTIVQGLADASRKNICSPIQTPAASSSSPSQKQRLQDFETDVPLIPHHLTGPNVKDGKTVSFPIELQKIIPSSEIDTTTSSREEEIEACIGKAVAPFAALAISKLENERLVELDTTMRVAVPDGEETKRHLHSRPESKNEEVMQRIAESLLTSNDKKWGGLSKVERILPWSPFPAYLAKVPMEESFDENSLFQYMAEIDFGHDIDTEDLLWKPEGQRILDDHDSDDEQLETTHRPDEAESSSSRCLAIRSPSQPEQQTARDIEGLKKMEAKQPSPGKMDMQTLLRKRKLELEHTSDLKRSTKQPKQNSNEAKEGQTQTSHWTAFNDLANASGLSNFMQLRGEAVQAAEEPREQQILTQPEALLPLAATVNSKPQDQPEYEIMHPTFPTPGVRDLRQESSVVLSSDLIADRQLIREIRSILPTVDLVERAPIAPPNTNVSKSSKQGDRCEADVTISPEVGLIFTTLQKLKQKPLPGQSTFFGIRERIQHVAARYEHLIVLVNKGRQHLETDLAVTSPLDESDSEALSDLIAFSARLNTDLEVYYAAGGERELARWTATFICRYSISASDIGLVHEETFWGRFLRFTGLNAFAAQAILSQLKKSERNQLSEGSSSTLSDQIVGNHGLAAFIRMSADQRVGQFGSLMGGDRVLQRVNDAIDTHWISASAAMQ